MAKQSTQGAQSKPKKPRGPLNSVQAIKRVDNLFAQLEPLAISGVMAYLEAKYPKNVLQAQAEAATRNGR